MIVLDTHVLLWLMEGNARLGRKAKRTVDAALRTERLVVPTIAFWEIGMRVAKGRVRLDAPVAAFRREVVSSGVREQPLDGAIAIAAAELKGLPGDPADRFVAATAMALDGTLLTADETLLRWKGPLRVQDATR